MLSNVFGWPHLIIIALVLLLLFGATRLPALSRSLGQSMRILRKDFKDMKKDDGDPLEPTPAENVAAPVANVPAVTVPSTANTVKASEL